MSAIAFDSHAFVKKLIKAGMPEEQAEVLAESQTELIDEKLATKKDLKELETELKHEIKELESRMTIRLGSLMVIAVGAVAALVRIL
jgi:hypothetical protein